ncbi:MAG: DUF5615 family PIN-like protein [Bacillota bacterium]
MRQAGHQADHVRGVGLRGRPDREVFQWAQDHQAVLVTGDMGFASTVTFPLGSHWGIIVLRFPNEASVASVNKELLAAVAVLSEEDIRGSIVVLEPGGRVRIRRPSQSL